MKTDQLQPESAPESIHKKREMSLFVTCIVYNARNNEVPERVMMSFLVKLPAAVYLELAGAMIFPGLYVTGARFPCS